jgi:hypothetical protein
VTKECDVLALFDHRCCDRIEHYLQVLAVPKTQLLARDDELRVAAVANEARAVLWAHHHHRVGDIVDKALVVPVMQVDVAV